MPFPRNKVEIKHRLRVCTQKNKGIEMKNYVKLLIPPIQYDGFFFNLIVMLGVGLND